MRGSDADEFTDVGGKIYFAATSDAFGRELHYYDTVLQQTFLVRDLRIGPEGSNPRELVAAGSSLFFVATTTGDSSVLWELDAQGQLAVASPVGDFGHLNLFYDASSGHLLFAAIRSGMGRELGTLDTATGVVRMYDLNQSQTSWSSPSEFCSVRGYGVFFVATDSPTGFELWQIQPGPSAAPSLFLDVYPGGISSQPRDLVASGTLLYFTARTAQAGRELMRTDARQLFPSAQVLADLQRGTANSDPAELTVCAPSILRHDVYFTAVGSSGRELYRFSSSNNVVSLVSDLMRGSASSNPQSLTHFGANLAFSASSDSSGRVQRVLGLVDVGTGRLSTVNPVQALGFAPGDLTVLGGSLVIAPDSGSGRLWISDASSRGTVPFGPSLTDVGGMTAATGAAVILRADSSASDGDEPHRLQANGSFSVLSEINQSQATDSSRPRDLAPMPTSSSQSGSLVCVAESATDGEQLFVTDGTRAGTRQLPLPGATAPQPQDVTTIGDRIWFSATDPQHGRELWAWEGDPATPRRVADLIPGPQGGAPTNFVELDGDAVFSQGNDLWVSDGTSTGTLFLGTLPGTVEATVAVGGFVVAAAQNASADRIELWRTDGTAAGTLLLRHFPRQRANASYEIQSFVGRGARVFLPIWSRDPGPGGLALRVWYATDATSAGSVQITPTPFRIERFDRQPVGAALGDTLVFAGFTSTGGHEPWISDGTVNGTQLLQEVRPQSDGSITDSSWMASAGQSVFLSLFDATHGQDLWQVVSQNGVPTLQFVADVASGSFSGLESGLSGAAVGSAGAICFAGNPRTAGDDDHELHLSDGTSAGTVRIADLWPGSLGSNPQHFMTSGDRLYFVAEGREDGVELWSTRLAVLGQPNVVSYGSGCSAPGQPALVLSSLGQPIAGNTAFAQRVAPTAPGHPTVLLIGGSRATTPVGVGCQLLTTPLATLVTTSQLGSTTFALPVPNSPGLIGASVFCQAVLFDPAVGGPAFGFGQLTQGLEFWFGN